MPWIFVRRHENKKPAQTYILCGFLGFLRLCEVVWERGIRTPIGYKPIRAKHDVSSTNPEAPFPSHKSSTTLYY